jgi:hypothetical protein
MGRMVAHPQDVVDHGRDPCAGPHLPAKPEGFGPPSQEAWDRGPLLDAQPWFATWGRVSAQCFSALLSCPCEPLAHGPRRHAECRRDIPLLPALLVEFPRPKPTTFLPVPRLSRGCGAHAS